MAWGTETMRPNPDNAPEKQLAYREKLVTMKNADLFRETKDKI